MNSFAKNVLLYGAEFAVSLVIGTTVGVGVCWLLGREINRDAIVIVIASTSALIIYFTVIGVFPVGKFPRDEKKP